MRNVVVRKLPVMIRKALVTGVALCIGSVALADRYRDDYRWHGNPHGGYVREYPHWREGNWYHGNHGGRFGWWWTVNGFWYFYPQPVYPYPDPYTPPVVVVQQPEPSSAPPMSSQPMSPPPAQNWYYCNSAKNYYPYIASCPEGWQMVPATPPEQ